MKTLVYALVDPRTDDVRYVGITSVPLVDRVIRHVDTAKHGGDSYVCRWLKVLINQGMEPEFFVLSRHRSREAAGQAERKWIRRFKRDGVRLTNSTDGGEHGFVMSAEARERQGASKRGKPKSEAHRAAISAAVKARWAGLSEESRASHRAGSRRGGSAGRGKSKSPEHIAAIQAAKRESIKGSTCRT